MIRQAGFENVELVAETGFNSSPKTKGVLIRGIKPETLAVEKEAGPAEDSFADYQAFSDSVFVEGVINIKTKYLIALAASLAAGCDPLARRCLAAARKLGAGEAELNETVALAMTVAATRVKILQEDISTDFQGEAFKNTSILTEERPLDGPSGLKRNS